MITIVSSDSLDKQKTRFRYYRDTIRDIMATFILGWVFGSVIGVEAVHMNHRANLFISEAS